MARLFTAANSERFVVNELVRGVSPVSMACWFYAVNAASDDYAMLQLSDQSTATNFFRLGFAGARGTSDFREIMAFVGGSADADAALTPATVLNEWHHALAVFPDVDSRSAYLDGVQAETVTTVTHPTGIDAMDIGFEGDSTPGDPWDGRLADVAVWDIALTPNDAAMLAAGYSPLLVRPDHLIFFAPLLLHSGDERDFVGGKTLVDTNTVTFADPPRLIRIGRQPLITMEGPTSANGAPSIPAVTASGTAEIKRNASGVATLAAIVAVGAALVIHPSNGAASIAPVEAAGTAQVVNSASGAATIPAIEASGTASVGNIEASGTPSIPAISAAGAASIPLAPVTYKSVTAALGGTPGADTLVVNSVPGGTDQLYLVHVNLYTNGGTAGTSEVATVTGGGLTFALVPGTVSCSGRISQPRQEMWWAFGSPSAFNLTVVLDNVPSDFGFHVAVSCLGGAANQVPSNADYSNVNGDSGGPACSGGTDNDLATLDMTVSETDSMVVNQLHPRNDDVTTVDVDYTQQYFVEQVDGGTSSTMGIYTRSDPPVGVDEIQHLLGGDKPWQMVGVEIEQAAAPITASGTPSITALTSAGTALVRKQANGNASITPVEASGAATVHREASGAVSITAIEASGTASVVRSASGAATLAPVEASGFALVSNTASGDATLTPVEASGTAAIIRNASGAASIAPIESAGTATHHKSASGAATIAPVEAAGTASVANIASGAATITAIEAAGTALIRKQASGAASITAIEAAGTAEIGGITSSGAATIPAIESAGTAQIIKNASGAATTPPVEAAGTATVANTASGAATIGAVEASGAALVIRTASGAASIAPIEASGTATTVNAASGAATLTPIESAGTATVHRSASGAASIAAIESAGSATVANTASGSASTPPVEAAGTASIIRNASGAASTPPVEAAGTALTTVSASGAASIPAVQASGTAVVHRSASGAASITPIEASGTATVANTASGSAIVPAVQAAGTALVSNTASGAATIPAIEGSGTASVISAIITASGAPSLTPIEAAGAASINPVGVASTIEIIGRVITQRINGRV